MAIQTKATKSATTHKSLFKRKVVKVVRGSKTPPTSGKGTEDSPAELRLQELVRVLQIRISFEANEQSITKLAMRSGNCATTIRRLRDGITRNPSIRTILRLAEIANVNVNF